MDRTNLGAAEIVEEMTREEIELLGKPEHVLEHLEILRRCLKSILKKEVLESLMELYKALDKGPEQWVWFKYNSMNAEAGGCKYQVMALEKFKRQRADRVKELLSICLEKMNQLER